MKLLEHYSGVVNKISEIPEPSYVTLKNERTGETVDTEAITEKLLEMGVDAIGCKFDIFIEQNKNGEIVSRLEKDNKTVDEERFSSTQDFIDKKINFNTLDKIGTVEGDEILSNKEKIKRLESELAELKKKIEN